MALPSRRHAAVSPQGNLIRNATLVFDLDGTIADTAGDLIEAANVALAAQGFSTASPAAIRHGVGYGAKAMLRAALDETREAADEAELDHLAQRLVAFYEQRIAVQTTLFPGFLDAALALRGRGAKLALCTNKTERLMTRLLSELGIAELFEAAAGRDTFPFHKPDPRHITQLVAQAGGRVPFAAMIGDSEADIAAARGAGIAAIAVRFGYAAVPADALGADAVLDSFAELPDLVERLLGRVSSET
ncbi:HAD-IA family hydrolase [Rhodomicrobium vannielii ATCC 17100]|uniref:HAD-IA family hydrolase n=1 Tax=Rhodomicrobium vannielii TaxID=1069 RepID=UPI00191A50B8|nr:HAD-IA family hydrolase [Rhodomicrobium vannielii]MBJ7533436.1 HAD-IA family hydrolase [Rhodomicrobium vannielii ATCC 17100]